MQRFLPFILFLVCAHVQAQVITVRFLDKQNNDGVAFANVALAGGKYIGSADVDGKLTVREEYIGKTCLVRALGYEQLEFIPNEEGQVIFMVPTSKELDEVVILPGENPAHRIIRNAIQNRHQNDPERCCRLTYESYNKLVFFPEFDSAAAAKAMADPKDSSFRKFMAFNDRSYLFMTESVTEKKHIPPDHASEKVLAARVSGFENPLFTILSTELQSFSFYNDQVSLMGEKYLSPLSPGSVNKYLFILKDTIWDGKDTTYIISFQPKRNRSFKAMRGEVHISTDRFALVSIKAQPAFTPPTYDIKIQQLHQRIEGSTWFPHQLNARIEIKNASVNEMKILGEATGYIRKVRLNADLRGRDISELELEMPDKTTDQKKLLESYRGDTLTEKERNTYKEIDSLSQAVGLEKKMKKWLVLATGKIPIGPVQLDLKRLIDFNDYEGFRVGMGLETSDQVVKWGRVGGYGAYGFKDKAFKYGGYMELDLYPRKDIHLDFIYQQDLSEAAPAHLIPTGTFQLFSDDAIREFYLYRFDTQEKKEVVYRMRFFKYFALRASASQSLRIPTYDYAFLLGPDPQVTLEQNSFQLFQTQVNLRFRFREKFLQSGNTLISTGSKWPTLQVAYQRSWKGVLDGTMDLWRWYAQFDHTVPIRHLGQMVFRISYSESQSDAPYFYLCSPAATYASFGISAANTFETMRPYEFTVDKGYAFHFTHQFLSALFHRNKNKGIQLELCASAFYGSLKSADLHQGFALQSPDKVYTEAGFRLKRLLKLNTSSFGLGVFYRFGAYSLPEWTDNFALRITTGFTLD